jgi:hypothetical protein
MADHSESIAQFISTTNASESQAQFYLGMTEWNLEVNNDCVLDEIMLILLVL